MPDLTTSALLAIIAPHRDMLREMGWGLQRIADKCDSLVYVVRYFEHGVSHCDVDTALAARILCDVCMEALEKWVFLAYTHSDARYFEVERNDNIGFTGTAYHKDRAEGPDICERVDGPTRLAALLALLAWCKEVKG